MQKNQFLGGVSNLSYLLRRPPLYLVPYPYIVAYTFKCPKAIYILLQYIILVKNIATNIGGIKLGGRIPYCCDKHIGRLKLGGLARITIHIIYASKKFWL